jgi:hypothetical protein
LLPFALPVFAHRLRYVVNPQAYAVDRAFPEENNAFINKASAILGEATASFEKEQVSVESEIVSAQKGKATDAADRAVCHLMNMPKELLFMVYDYCFVPRVRPFTVGGYGLAYDDLVPERAVTGLSREIRGEVWEATRLKQLSDTLVLYLMNHHADIHAIREVFIMAD